MASRFIGTKEFAALLEVSANYVLKNYEADDWPPFERLGKKKLRWQRQVVEDWINQERPSAKR
jgi:predicted DNA-binding transcriptional regulator AlpA